METLLALPLPVLLVATLVGLVAGFVKGVVGFAMPMILISGLGSVMPPELALAALIVPTLVSNTWQALRQGLRAAVVSTARHWRFLAVILTVIAISAQFVTFLTQRQLFLILGVPVTLFAAVQLAGWQPRIAAAQRRAYEFGAALVAGAIGGLAGVWGPPTVMYLTALDTPKDDSKRVQGVVYGAGALVLAVAHLGSGVLSAQTAPLSVAMLLPTTLGLLAGFAVGDRVDQARFRRLTLVVLVVAGMNLVRRALM